eukprot:4557079-Alexandrium_andersonii.AAC.1
MLSSCFSWLRGQLRGRRGLVIRILALARGSGPAGFSFSISALPGFPLLTRPTTANSLYPASKPTSLARGG